MKQQFIQPDEWKIIEEGFDPDRVKSSESIFSLGNGSMGHRANFEEKYLAQAFKGVMLLGFIIQTKHVLGGGKMATQTILPRF